MPSGGRGVVLLLTTSGGGGGRGFGCGRCLLKEVVEGVGLCLGVDQLTQLYPLCMSLDLKQTIQPNRQDKNYVVFASLHVAAPA